MEEEYSEAQLILYLKGEYADEEERRIEAWLRADAKRLRTMQRLKQIWDAAERPMISRDVDQMWEGLSEKIEASEEFDAQTVTSRGGTQRRDSDRTPMQRRTVGRRRSRSTFRRIATVFLVLGVSALLALYMTHTSGGREIVTTTGERATIRLNDGTEVTLNAESKLAIPSTFGTDGRDARLQGEAYFEVSPDEDRPFRVHTSNATTRVLGTKFGAVSYPGDSETQVVVAEGKVAVESRQNAEIDTALLGKDDLATISSGGKSRIIRRSVEAREYLAWTEGQLVFKDASFREVADKLRRWYGVEVQLTDTTSSPDRLNATFYEEEPVGEVLSVIAKTLRLRYEREEERVMFYP